MFFNNREELAKLYQAIRPDKTIRPEDIEINTLEDVILDQQKNDVSFAWNDQSIVLTEHQSTINPNMPARMLIYASRLLLGTLADKKALYRKKLIYLPTIREAITYCIQHKIMQSFLESCREEVLQMMTFQWNAEEAKKVQEEERQEDIQEAETRGKAEGITATTLKVVRNLLKKKLLSYEEIADTTDTTIDEVIRIAKESHLSY